MRNRGIQLAISGLLLLLGLGYVQVGSIMAQDGQVTAPPSATQQNTNPTPQPHLQPTATPPPYDLIFSAEPGPDIETFQQIAGSATTDADILKNVVDYYNANKDRLAILWREDNPARLAGIFSMYLVHISTIYGVVQVFPSSLNEYLNDPRAHCGTYTWAQMQIADALGLTWRTVEFVGEHAWLEIKVDGNWEVFDGTTNTWLSIGVDQLMQGLPREYRQFYTPLLDPNRPDARWHMAEGYNMQALRQKMPGVGITYMPPGQLKLAAFSGGPDL